MMKPPSPRPRLRLWLPSVSIATVGKQRRARIAPKLGSGASNGRFPPNKSSFNSGFVRSKLQPNRLNKFYRSATILGSISISIGRSRAAHQRIVPDYPSSRRSSFLIGMELKPQFRIAPLFWCFFSIVLNPIFPSLSSY